jgi:hypothetical protein
MTNDRLRELGTCGACGEIAKRLLARVGGVPYLRYENGAAVHAAIKIGGRFVHLGDDAGLVEVDQAEFEEACQYYFDPDRVCATEEELDYIADLLAGEVD